MRFTSGRFPEPIRREQTLSLYALILFSFMLYIGPQLYYTFLVPFQLARNSAILAALAYIFHRDSQFTLDFEARCLILVALLAFMSIPFSLWPGGSWDMYTGLYVKAVIIFLLISNVLSSVRRVKQMSWFLVLFCTYLALFTINQYLSRGFLPGTMRIVGTETGMGANPNDIALTLALMVPMAMVLFATAKRQIERIFSGAYILLATAGIVLTYSRGAFLSLLTGCGVVLYRSRMRKNLMKTAAVVFVLVMFVLLISPQAYRVRLASILEPSLDPTGTAERRRETIIWSLPLIAAHPGLGVGIGMSEYANYLQGRGWVFLHNVYMQTATEIGVPAMILFLLALYRLIRSMRRVQSFAEAGTEEEAGLETKWLARGLEGGLLAFAVAGLTYPASWNFYFYYLAGLALALKRTYLVSNPHLVKAIG